MDTRDEKELDTALRKAMADLDPDERAILIRKTAGFSGDEIADRYSRSADAVEAQVERVRQGIRRFMRTRH
jgi:DNA-directed RNA polymerase specialized sigma24 family protein